MKTKIFGVLIPILIAAAALCICYAHIIYSQQRDLADKLIRLHIIANSDTEFDQDIKLHVRDSVNEYLSSVLSGCETKEQAELLLTNESEAIREIAENTVVECGAQFPVTVNISNEYYPTREYVDFSLPAGDYTSLQIKIGDGAGHNWWCVVFPPVCTSAATAEALTEMDFSEEEVKLITSDDESIALRFKLLEIISELKNMFMDKENM